MGQKVNPISLRLEKTNRHFDSCWYSDYNYTDLLLQDLKIKNYLKTVLKQIQYPEGRVLIENLPKKSNINLFYHNPSNSRRKKNVRFQLQNYKIDNKKNKKTYSFSKEKYWSEEKSQGFTLAQQGLSETKLLQLKKPFYSLSNLTQTTITKQANHHLGIKEEKKTSFNKESIQYSKIKEIIKGTRKQPLSLQTKTKQKNHNVCASLVETSLVKLFSYKEKVSLGLRPKEVENNINSLLLQFVLNPLPASDSLFSKKTEKERYYKGSVDGSINRDGDKKWVVERFFVRYLLAQLYGKFLQNKSVYSQENLRTLYQFCLFFQEKSVKQNSLKQVITNKDQQKPEKGITKIHKGFVKGSKIVPSGLYSSNLIYKLHIESFLSKQHNTFFNLRFFRSLTEKQGAFFLLQEIIYYLERKMPFRRIKTQILREIPHYKRIKGIRITCSGRVGGRSKKAQRSKIQSVKIGQTSLGVFSSKIDFASKSALTRFGLIGVKVWVCYQ